MEISLSGVSRFVQELFEEEVKKYYFDNLKTYCPQTKKLIYFHFYYTNHNGTSWILQAESFYPLLSIF